MSALRMAGWAIVLGLLAFSLGTFDGLPDRIPTGIDANGDPRGYRDRALWFWMLVPLIALLIQGMLEWIRRSLPAKPHLFNFPDKERFLKLPPPYRGPVIAAMRSTLDVVTAVGHLPLVFVQYMLWQSARGVNTGSGVVVLLLSGVFIGPAILLAVGRVSSAADAAHKRWQADGSPTA